MVIGTLAQVINEANDDYIASIIVDKSVISMCETGSHYLLEALANEDYHTIIFNEDTNLDFDKVTENLRKRNAKEFIDANTNALSFFNWAYKKDNDVPEEVTIDQITNAGKMHEFRNEKSKQAFEAETKDGLWEMCKRAFHKGRDFVAKLIDKLNTWMRKIAQKEIEAGKHDYSKLGFFSKIKRNIVTCIEWLTRKLHNMVQKNRGNISKYQYAFDKTNPSEKTQNIARALNQVPYTIIQGEWQ